MNKSNNTSNRRAERLTTIGDDAPFGNINFFTISFLSPEKVEKTKYLDIRGFKIHNGYNTLEVANSDAKELRKKYIDHDVYVTQLGKVYSWDDPTKTDSIEYEDEKLNELEKTRKEHTDKVKLMQQQFKNEFEIIRPNINTDRLNNQKKRLRDKLYSKGLISKAEYEMAETLDKPTNEIKDIAVCQKQAEEEAVKMANEDYLDENPPVGIKFGCISIYSPKFIRGLKQFCFKLRGLFESQEELEDRVNKLHKIYPNDRIHTFEVGKWIPYSDTIDDNEVSLNYLNYSMKCYLDNVANEREEFEKRKDNLQKQNEEAAKITKRKNRQEKRREKRLALKEAKNTAKTSVSSIPDTSSTTTSTNSTPTNTKSNSVQNINHQGPVELPDNMDPAINESDKEAIQNILDYIEN
ncbi:hypothetical protein [Acanthamoeba castellanii mimivirus]|uniref:Uncharacterized protein R435 n=5 Tax=Mimivirus TaxID=315393 RepID=YR435_MIMIV|nr:hypothetical protein MIMI_gp0465 [Acanthamoeba polyphaga mimivirus]Q5UQN1.1 RecName: Full=Uncharacterized protein R435 [Acanthamoeba polyphaga mimivirus]AEQ60619.1 hypothetical protein [Acanthamoeba castellanii mamavirus]ALR84025.1 hypothetical protein [Niemeyer virus]AMK61898.1 hypothetical protein [Samba virus]AMZ02879.1 hypothetical protein [Mimivirus Bombay]EJN40870.1 hypothetical protein lvs_R366 [Acanthamoeba polyphaga lentillevirus]BAV61536.1 hypothetical protein [Acanthamoeba cast